MRIIAFRAWRVKDKNLQSLSYDYFWKPGINKYLPDKNQESNGELHPTRTCECGYYGYWASNLERLLETIHPSTGEKYLVGAILCSGRLALHEDSVRSSKAEIAALFDPGTGPLEKIKTYISWYYRVPFLPSLKALEVFAKEHGRLINAEDLQPDPKDICKVCGWDHIALQIGVRLNRAPVGHFDQALAKHGVILDSYPWGSTFDKLLLASEAN